MRKRRVVFICVTGAIVGIFVFLNVWDYLTVSHTKDRVSLDRISGNQTVLVVEELNFSAGGQVILVVNKNGQVKCVSKDLRRKAEEFTPTDYDTILRDKTIPFSKEKIKLSDRTLCNIINIDDYKMRKKQRGENNLPYYTYYSVCGSGTNRKMVVMKEDGVEVSTSQNIAANRICERMYDVFMQQ